MVSRLWPRSLPTESSTRLSSLFRAGTESHLIAASLGQSRRTSFRALKQIVESRPDFESFRGSLRIETSVLLPTFRPIRGFLYWHRRAQRRRGLSTVLGDLADEPGAWETIGGEAMYTAIQTAQGKPGSPLRALYLGTLAPGKGQWWLDLVKGGSSETRFVTSLAADPKKWDELSEVKRVQPAYLEVPRIEEGSFRRVRRGETRRASRRRGSCRIPAQHPDKVRNRRASNGERVGARHCSAGRGA